jgi:hypothetical protein
VLSTLDKEGIFQPLVFFGRRWEMQKGSQSSYALHLRLSCAEVTEATVVMMFGISLTLTSPSSLDTLFQSYLPSGVFISSKWGQNSSVGSMPLIQ